MLKREQVLPPGATEHLDLMAPVPSRDLFVPPFVTRTFVWFVLVALVLEGVERTTGLGCSLILSLPDLIQNNAFYAQVLALPFFLYLLLEGRRGPRLAALVGGVGAELLSVWWRSRYLDIPWWEHLLHAGGGLGIFGCLCLLAHAARVRSEARQAWNLVQFGLFLPLSFLLATWQLAAINTLTQLKVYDQFAYMADRMFGEVWCFYVKYYGLVHPPFALFFNVIYFCLAWGILYVQLVSARRPRQFSVDPTTLFTVVGFVGGIYYLMFPEVGPELAFPDRYPASPPFLRNPVVFVCPDAYAPRSTMPSLHMAWALSLFWLGRDCSWRMRLVFALNLLATPIAALLASHYVVDFVAAVPLTASMLCALRLLRGPLGRASAWLTVATFLAFNFYLVWILVGVHTWLGRPWLMIAPSLVCVVLGFGCEEWTRRRVKRAETSSASASSVT